MPRFGSSVATIAVLGAIAFVNAMGAVIVFPLGPFLARDLGVPLQDAALTSTVYTAAAGIGGLAGALFLGRWSRRGALVGSLGGLGLGMVAAGLAPDFRWLLLARFLSGLCAGPLMAAVVTIAAEAVSEDRRNRVVSAIVGSYGLALVLGLPFALLLSASAGGWRIPVLVLGAACLALLLPAWRMQRPARAAEPGPKVTPASLLRLLLRAESLTGLALIGAASFASLLIAPHLSGFALGNAGVGEAGLRAMYLFGGGMALVTTRVTGWVMDRIGTLQASLGVGALLTVLLVAAFMVPLPPLVAVPLLGAVLAGQLARSTVAQASATRVAQPSERMTYQCLVAAATSLGQAAGAACSTLVLHEAPGGGLAGMGGLAGLSIALAWLAPLLVVVLNRQLRRRDHR
ncbi:putative MFS family arabinose efflux permease [Humitalea rosea]|uniref:Putative MFS family arabinose efflux permease n=1 Tax=Humitalea rosea TaxID=990373 RepID=A0A2W7I1N8_9PROT|nr:MFS transporter [Humitalea rosea]PZW39352.1 putative MFS family arabinose efflux permease [Humitalea rosea]